MGLRNMYGIVVRRTIPWILVTVAEIYQRRHSYVSETYSIKKDTRVVEVLASKEFKVVNVIIG